MVRLTRCCHGCASYVGAVDVMLAGDVNQLPVSITRFSPYLIELQATFSVGFQTVLVCFKSFAGGHVSVIGHGVSAYMSRSCGVGRSEYVAVRFNDTAVLCILTAILPMTVGVAGGERKLCSS